MTTLETTPDGVDDPLVRIVDVRKSYGHNLILDSVSLDIQPGEVVVVAGPSGSGKSTMLRCINGLETIDSGSVSFRGRTVSDFQQRRRMHELRTEIGMVFQGFNLFPHLTALENVTLAPRHVRKKKHREREQHAYALLERVGIAHKAKARPSELSGGQQQRVAIARAMAMDPTLMLFDEPTSALDPEMIREVLDVMRELVEAGMTMVVVTHEMGFARQAADRVVFMADGRIRAAAPPAQFFGADQGDPRVRDFLDKVLHH